MSVLGLLTEDGWRVIGRKVSDPTSVTMAGCADEPSSPSLSQPIEMPSSWDAKGIYCSLDKFRCNGWNTRKKSNNCPYPFTSQRAQWWWSFVSRPSWVHEDGSCSARGMVVYVVCTSHCLAAMTKHRLKEGWVFWLTVLEDTVCHGGQALMEGVVHGWGTVRMGPLMALHYLLES